MIRLTASAPSNIRTDLLVIPVWESSTDHWNAKVAEWIHTATAVSEFSGKKGEHQLRYGISGARSPRTLFQGLGKAEGDPFEGLRRAAGKGVKSAIDRKLGDVTIVLPALDALAVSEAEVLEALAEGALLSNTVSDRFKTDGDTPAPVGNLRIAVRSPKTTRLKTQLKRVEPVCRATLLARDWVNTPSNHKRPESLAAEIRRTADRAGLKASVLGRERLRRLKMGALLAVGEGSDSRPALVVLEHRPKGATRTVVLVGKGITFDTGGYNIKPTGSMETMKIDMAGAAAVAATLIAAPALDLKCNLIGLLPLAENMVSAEAYRPGDVIQTYAGKTVEIGNTDAEGRLVLADAMAYAAKRFKPDLMIDLATLTGACVVALGESIAGVFSPHDALRSAIQQAGEAVNERCWPMPLPDDYRERLKSDTADLRNIGRSRWGGAILAALFLSEFVGETRWAHIDIAGPAAAKKGTAYCGPGGTGFGVRLLCRLLSNVNTML